MKKIILILFVIFMSCKNSNPKNKNNDLIDEDIEYVDLIGDFKKNDLNKPPYRSWFFENYNNHELDIETIGKINNILSERQETNKDGDISKTSPYLRSRLSIKVIMGTWCSDSRENVPAFIKLMDYLKFSRYQLIGLDVEKKNPRQDELLYEIINVPTFIFYDDKEEINRIVELTIESIEKDILKILDGSGYENAYYGF